MMFTSHIEGKMDREKQKSPTYLCSLPEMDNKDKHYEKLRGIKILKSPAHRQAAAMSSIEI